MARLAFVVVALGCGGLTPPSPSRPVPVEPIAVAGPTCNDAATGLELATRGVRAPEQSVLEGMRSRCAGDRWPGTAIECFAHMRPDDLAPCAERLDDRARRAMFGVFDSGPAVESLDLVKAQLVTLQLGIAECDRFVAAVVHVLGCEQMPLDTRLQLGTATADFWSLPPAASEPTRRKLATVCDESRAQLAQQAAGAGCMP